MRCYYQDKLKDFLEEKLSGEEMNFIEKHIEDCRYCQSELEMLLEDTLNLPGQEINIDDEILVSKIKARRKGRKRLVYYGILGFLLGLFSRFYVYDKFILTKAIMAIPYKISEFAMGIFFSRYKLGKWEQTDMTQFGGMGYFPFNPLLDALAQYITPVIIAIFSAMIIGYLSSDRRVFTRKKIIRFCFAAFTVFMLWVGIAFAIYSVSLKSFENLDKIKNIVVYAADENSTAMVPAVSEDDRYQQLYRGLIGGKKTEDRVSRKEAEVILVMDFTFGGRISGYVDFKTGIMTTQKNSSFKLNSSTIDILQELREEYDYE